MNEPQTTPNTGTNTNTNTSSTNYASKMKSALADVRFPATKDEILQSKGTSRVDVATGRNVTLREALAPIRVDRFETPEALLNEISTAHRLDWPRQ